MTREKFKTKHGVFDNFTNRNLFKLITQGHFEGLYSPIFIGKESNIFSAKTKTGLVIVKIYRLETCDFNRMYDYLKYDPRFPSLKKKRRKVIFAWAQREYRNLLKARQAGVAVPKPITILFNIVVMEFIGKKEPAPKLKDAKPKKPKQFADNVIDNMAKLKKAGLIHGDLSSFNILNNQEKPVFIDFSQCTTTESPLAEELLERDIRNIVNHFNKLGLKLDIEKIKKKTKK